MSGLVGRIALGGAVDTAKGVLKSIPREVWYALAIALAIAFVRNWYGNQIEAAEKRGSDSAYASIEKQARAIEQKANGLTGNITTLMRNWSDEDNRRISAGADTLRLRGPGQAVCTSVAGLPAAPGEHGPASGTGDAPLGRVSYPKWSDLIAMPFDDLIERAEKCDLNRSEVNAWREWWSRQNTVWKQLQSEGTRP